MPWASRPTVGFWKALFFACMVHVKLFLNGCYMFTNVLYSYFNPLFWMIEFLFRYTYAPKFLT
jgi:hypothetical protein